MGIGKLRNDRTTIYFQDASGRGLNLYNESQVFEDLVQGTEIKVVGTVELYNTTVEIKDFAYQIISTGNDLPDAQTVTIAGANSSAVEGTWIQVKGTVAEKFTVTGGDGLEITDGTDTTVVMIWGTTGIDAGKIYTGDTYWFRGIGSNYNGTYQILTGYDEDIWIPVAIEDEISASPLTFKLNPAFPNPFNPSTTITWQLAKPGDYSLAIYNMLGQKLTVLAEEFGKAGHYSKTLQAGNLT